ncbi:hypothetical protein [Proteiniphilum sp.]|uniref:hypothetical protein n=1 Tax=Proteiniphilum sp. TaxID=1926877 RepID=UPI002B1EC762|nr:hypothetical protein [Proteiniphilum sp.]MEA4917373.1 hypothetical protein [Proteiniphilum sp.]
MHRVKDVLFRISGILILLSAGLHLAIPTVAPWVMAFSVVVFTAMTLTNPYPGKSIRGKRLFNFQLFSCILMIVATYLMFRERNEWVLAMIVSAIFLLYASVMIPRELEREKNRP